MRTMLIELFQLGYVLLSSFGSIHHLPTLSPKTTYCIDLRLIDLICGHCTLEGGICLVEIKVFP